MEGLPSELLDKFLTYLSDEEIIRCSAVNKRWRSICRSYLKVYRHCFAAVVQPLQNLTSLDNALADRKLDYIKGIYIDSGNELLANNWVVPWPKPSVCYPIARSTGLQHFVLDLSIRNVNARGIEFVRAMLVSNQLTIESVTFRGGHNAGLQNIFEFLWGQAGDAVYPKLEVIKVEGSCLPCGYQQQLSQPEVVPNLKAIHGRCVLVMPGIVIPSLMRCVRQFIMPVNFEGFRGTHIQPSFDAINRLDSLEFYCDGFNRNMRGFVIPDYMGVMNRTAGLLQRLIICSCHLLSCRRQFPGLVFSSVKYLSLSLHTGRRTTNADIYRTIVIVACPTIFPKVKMVSVAMDFFKFYEENRDNNCATRDAVLNLRNYLDHIHDISRITSVVSRFSHLCVRVLNFGKYNTFSSSSCFNIRDITALTFVISCDWSMEDVRWDIMDAFICGIHIEEAIRLRNESVLDSLDLTKYHIVPVRPGLQSAIGIQSVRFFEQGGGPRILQYISDVSMKTTINRLPHIQVTVGACV